MDKRDITPNEFELEERRYKKFKEKYPNSTEEDYWDAVDKEIAKKEAERKAKERGLGR